MYWEDVYRLAQIASNHTENERNANLKFQFMLQADEKSAKKWVDSPLPFPTEEYLASQKRKRDVSGISQLPMHLKKTVVKRSFKNKAKKKNG